MNFAGFKRLEHRRAIVSYLKENCPQKDCQLVAAQTCLNQNDYYSWDKLYTVLDDVMNQIERNRKQEEEIVVVFPELIGAWLILCDQPFSNPILSSLYLISTQPYRFMKILIRNIRARSFGSIHGLVIRSLFQLEANRMLILYDTIFSSLSSRYNAWIIAGSSYLPQVMIRHHRPYLDPSTPNSLFNVSLAYSSKGKVVNVTTKCHPVDEELAFLDSGQESSLNSFFAPGIGQIGTLICADSWYEDAVKQFDVSSTNSSNRLILCVPSFLSPVSKINQPWKGYSGSNTPEKAKSDVDRVTEAQAWRKFAFPGILPGRHLNLFGINSFFHGDVFGYSAGGRSLICQGNFIQRETKQIQSTKHDLLSFLVPKRSISLESIQNTLLGIAFADGFGTSLGNCGREWTNLNVDFSRFLDRVIVSDEDSTWSNKVFCCRCLIFTSFNIVFRDILSETIQIQLKCLWD